MMNSTRGWSNVNVTNPDQECGLANFNVTGVRNSTATITFYGSTGNNDTRLLCHGEKCSDHGSYGFSLEDKLLYSSPNLKFGSHTLTSINGTTVIDIDFFVFATGDADKSITGVNSTIDNSSSQVVYTSLNGWQTHSSHIPTYFNVSLHETRTRGAQTSIPFFGDALSMFGSMDTIQRSFAIQIDELAPVSFSGSALSFHSRTFLYFVCGLHHGDHTLTISNIEGSSLHPEYLTESPPVSVPTSIHHISTSNIPVIAGAISGICVVIFWMIGIFLFVRRRLKRRHNNTIKGSKHDEPHGEAYILPPDPAVVQGTHQPGTYAFTSERNLEADMDKLLRTSFERGRISTDGGVVSGSSPSKSDWPIRPKADPLQGKEFTSPDLNVAHS